jgi:O-antigen/teichoic acid export membrane protein
VIAGLQALIAPLVAIVEARLTLAATMAIRRAVLVIAATLFGVGALLFLSLGVFFGLMPGLGPAGAALILALIWALLAGLCYVLSLLRPRRVAATRIPTSPAVAPRAAPAAAPVPVPPPPLVGLAAQVSRAAPILALAALLAGIVAGRR